MRAAARAMAREPSSSHDLPAAGIRTRVSLEYQHACDLCALRLQEVEGPVAVIASSPFHAREALKRLAPAPHGPPGRRQLGLTWGASEADPGADLKTLCGPEVHAAAVAIGEDLHRPWGGVWWAEPEMSDGPKTLLRISQGLAPGGTLCIVASGWMAWRLPEWQGQEHPAQRPAGPLRAATWLRGAGFLVLEQYGFHGPGAILWGWLGQALALAGRHALADRCHFQMRAAYVVQGAQVRLSPVGALVARRG